MCFILRTGFLYKVSVRSSWHETLSIAGFEFPFLDRAESTLLMGEV